MAQVNAGRVRFVSRGEYNNSTQYYLFDLVNYEGSSYVAIANTLGNVPTNTTYWQLIAEKGNVGNTGPVGATGNGIANITKTGTSGLVDTYTISYTDGTTSTFEVTNGEDGEVTQAQFDKLQHRVDDLETNQLMDIVTGTEINITDAHETEIVEGKLSKESTQATPTYKGLLKIPKSLSQTKNDLTFVVNDDNSVTITGTSNATTTIDLALETPLILNGTYTFSLKTVGTISTSEQMQWLLYAGNSGSLTNLSLSPTVISNATTRKTNTINNTVTFLRVFATANRTLNCTIYPILEEGETATEWSEMPTISTPNPIYPQEIKTVKGYRNLFDKENYTSGKWIGQSGSISNDSNFGYSDYIEIKSSTSYFLSGLANGGGTHPGFCFYDTTYTYISGEENNGRTSISITTPANAKYIRFSFKKVDLDTIQLEEGTEELPYVPYGTNWIYTTISDGTNSRNITIPLNDNEIVGIGNYKDELIVDSDGHCWLNKKIEKIVLDGDTKKFISKSPYFTSDTKGFYQFSLSNKYVGNDGDTNNGKSNYFMFRSGSANNAFRNYANGLWWEGSTLNCYAILELTTLADANAWLSEHNTTIYYKLKESAFTLIDLNYDIDIRLFNGINNISNSEDMDMTIKYVQDINIIINELRN